MSNRVVLLSGGMDSFLTYQMLEPYEYIPVFIYGLSSYWEQDEQCVKRMNTWISYQRMKAPKMREDALTGVVLHRNITMLAMVANNYNASEIVISSPKGELIPDQQPSFYCAAERVLPGVKISNPIGKYTKAQAIKWYLGTVQTRRSAVHQLESNTRSCYSSEYMQCGRCPACLKRFIALQYNGIQERYEYNVVQYARDNFAQHLNPIQVLRYGIRPSYEAWKVMRKYV